MLINVYVASPDPDPNPRGRGNYPTLRVQFYANECNEGETLTSNPNECNSTLRVELVGAQPSPIPYILGKGVNYLKATSHSTIFDIPMRPLREDQKHRHRFTR